MVHMFHIMSRLFQKPSVALCSAVDSEAQDFLEDLNAALYKFYNSDFGAKYFERAESTGGNWTPKFRAHLHLKSVISYGSRVIDLGCGTAHPWRNLADSGICYTGVDWSESQIGVNRIQMPEHTFLASSLYEVPLPDGAFDVAMSLYVIEHLVWPHKLLDEMWRLVKPGGIIAILCPPFRIRNTIKSFPYGLSPGPFMEKVKSGMLLDAVLHFIEHRITYPAYLRAHYPRGTDRHRFLINLKPVCLTHRVWFPDADAVYLADTAEITAYLVSKGSELIVEWPKQGYVLVRKRGEGATSTRAWKMPLYKDSPKRSLKLVKAASQGIKRSLMPA